MPLPERALRGVLLEALRRDFGNQWGGLQQAVAWVATERHLYPALDDTRIVTLDAADEPALRNDLALLVAAGLVRIGMAGRDETWPWISLTAWGLELASRPAHALLPYDPRAYLAELRARHPSVGAVALQAAGEAAECLSRGVPIAAATMLGVASEAILREALEAHELAPAVRDRLDKAVTGLSELAGVAGHPLDERQALVGVEAATVHAGMLAFLDHAVAVEASHEALPPPSGGTR